MEPTMWPEWLTDEYTAIHNAIYNEIVKALEHCYESADAAGMDWTTEGWLSVSASNICGMLRRSGCPPPDVPRTSRLNVDEVHQRWQWDDEESAP